MSHLDEGQLHELLDGELDEPARAAALAHLATCERCKAAYDEAKSFLAEADALIDAVQLPATPVALAAAAAAPAATANVRDIASATRLRRYRTVAWAASLVLAVGLGWYGSSLSRPKAEAVLKQALDSVSITAPTAAPEVANADQAVQRQARPAAPPAPVTLPAEKSRVAAADEAKSTSAAGAGVEEALSAATNQVAAAPPAQTAPVAGMVASQDLRDAAPEPARAPAAFAPMAAEARRKENDQPLRARGPSFTRIEMEEAVRILGGSIRLIDGLSPSHILAGRAGGQVRVVYEDPPGRELWLDQARQASTGYAEGATTLLPGDTTAVAGPGGSRSLRWMDQSGFTLSLTGFLPADSLRQLMRRVQ